MTDLIRINNSDPDLQNRIRNTCFPEIQFYFRVLKFLLFGCVKYVYAEDYPLVSETSSPPFIPWILTHISTPVKYNLCLEYIVPSWAHDNLYSVFATKYNGEL